LAEEPEEKKPLGRPRRRWDDNTEKVHGGIRLEGVDRIHLAQDTDWWRAVVNTVMNLQLS
jgi:hypothetical protein